MPLEDDSPLLKNGEKSLDVLKHNLVDSTPLNEDVLKKAEEELQETPENKEKCLASLRQLILVDTNLTVPMDDDFLLRFLRARKYNSQKAFHMIQRYYIMRLKCPDLFTIPRPSENKRVFDLQAQTMLPNRDKFGRRVYIIRVDKFDASRASIEDIFRTNVLALEHIAREPITQITGLVVIVDMTGLSLQHAKFFTPYYARRTVEVVQETFPLRFKGFHVVNEPFYFDAIMAVLKPFLKDKIRKRIFLHGNDLTSLHAFVSPEILPFEYGGSAGPFNNGPWYRKLLDNEQYIIQQENYGYNVDNNTVVVDEAFEMEEDTKTNLKNN